MRYFFIILLITSCSSKSVILDYDRDFKILSVQSRNVFEKSSDVKFKAIEDANLYCKNMNKTVIINDVKESFTYQGASRTARADVIFRCD